MSAVEPGAANPRRFDRADAMLLSTALIWGVNFPIAKALLNSVPPMIFAGWRFLFAGLLLFVILKLRGERWGLPRGELARLAVLGFVGITAFQALWAHGVAMTTASKASILVNLSPAVAALIATLHGNSPSAKGWIGIMLSFAGVFLLINNSLTAFSLDGGTLVGDVLMMLGAVAWAIYTFYAAPLLQRLGPLKVTAWTVLIGALGLMPVTLWQSAGFDFAILDLRDWASFAYTVVFSAALGFAWWYEGVQRIGTTRTMVYSNMIPVFAVASAVAFLGETFSLVQTLGAVIVLVGIRLARSG